ncbi:hypothetical protein [Nonomuraea pusilla]|uniref:Secreted protein n=1 Tax=Nonomuraea pusilla TaxID=46177 RepID=A0A1H7FRN9_9ACTN|nr:hypothetical protein [Nonomuraea pusilla]SEK27867.1 hypothetical protein SAMN05660976_00154 [Nonomuraea pusilla]
MNTRTSIKACLAVLTLAGGSLLSAAPATATAQATPALFAPPCEGEPLRRAPIRSDQSETYGYLRLHSDEGGVCAELTVKRSLWPYRKKMSVSVARCEEQGSRCVPAGSARSVRVTAADGAGRRSAGPVRQPLAPGSCVRVKAVIEPYTGTDVGMGIARFTACL